MAQEPYRSRFTGEEIDSILQHALQHVDLTQAEYDTMKAAGQISLGSWYFIFGDQRKQFLMAVYCGTQLVARRSTSGSVGFPYNFPIIF